MFCTKCGKEFREGASFCTGCGAPRPKLEGPAPTAEPKAEPPIPETPPIPEPIPFASDGPEAVPAHEPEIIPDPEPDIQEIPREQTPAVVLQPTAPTIQPASPPPPPIDLEPSAPPQKKKGKGGLIALLLVLLLLIGGAAFVALCQMGLIPVKLPFELPFLSGGDGSGEADDPYPDTVDLADLIANPQNFDGQRVGVNAEVDRVDGTVLTALISSGKEELETALTFGQEDITTFAAGDEIYIDGTFHAGETYSFSPAIVTLTGGKNEGTFKRTAAGQSAPDEDPSNDGQALGDQPASEPWTTVADYTPYQGYFTSAFDADSFEANGGPVVVLSMERSSLLYEIYNYAADGTRAMLTGAAPMDGSTEISFYGDDGCENTVSGTLYLLENGSVAVESQVVDAGTAGWALRMPYSEMPACTFSDYFTEVQPPYNQQELRVTTNGPYATVALYNWKDGDWAETMSFQATIGANGASFSKQEGDKCTPAGTYDILFAFSTLDIFSGIPYERIEEDDVWVTDTSSIFYNTLQSSKNPDKDWNEAENLYDKFTSGRSTACIYFAFNGDGMSPYSAVAGGGSDLFLDGIGASGNLTTGYGDIKTDGQNVLDLLRELNGNKHPVIVIDN